MDTLCWESQMTRLRVQARHLKKGMLVRARPGHVIVLREFEFKVPGAKEGELGFTVMKSSAARFVKLAAAPRASVRVLDGTSPLMYYGTTKVKKKKKVFTKHTFLQGSELVYLHSASCRGLEPVII